jgi:hypothetical protein
MCRSRVSREQLVLARDVLRQGRVPVEIAVARSFYRLRVTGSYGFAIPRSRVPERDAIRLSIDRLRRERANGEFSSKEAARALGLSKSSAVALLRWGLGEGELVKSGNNRNTRYRFAR